MRRLSICGLLLVAVALLAPLSAAGFDVNMNYLPSSSPAFFSPWDNVLAVGTDGKLYAFDAEGHKEDEYPTGSTNLSSPTVSDGNSIFIADGNGNVHAFYNIFTGAWIYESGETITTDVAVDQNGNTYFGGGGGGVYAVGPDGNQKWVFNSGYTVTSTPVIGNNGKVYVATWDGSSNISTIHAIDGSGTATYVAGFQNRSVDSLSIGADGTLLAKLEDGQVYSVGPDGQLKWSFNTGSSSPPAGEDSPTPLVKQAPGGVSTPVIDIDGTVYVGSESGKFFAINPNGSKKWEYTAGGAIKSTAAIGADGIIYFGADDGWIHMLNRQGALVGWFVAGSAIEGSPTLTPKGMLYFGTADGKLHGLQTSSPGLAKSAWPMLMHDPGHTGRATMTATPSIFILLLE